MSEIFRVRRASSIDTTSTTHSGTPLLTPHTVQFGLAAHTLDQRQRVLTTAFQQYPGHFVRKPPRPAPLPQALSTGNRSRSAISRMCFSPVLIAAGASASSNTGSDVVASGFQSPSHRGRRARPLRNTLNIS